jgi:TetR/AcrR family transcriptional repressor of nem operon
MKVSREAAAETRRRIVETAGRLFRQYGYDGVGVADIMKQAGLTHGGFYGHFTSKDELAAEASSIALTSKAGIWEPAREASGDSSLERFLTSYLSHKHRDDPGDGCALAALGGDAGRASEPVRAAFTTALRGRVDKLTAMIPGRSAAAKRRKALATLSGAVGALVLARAVADDALSDEILDAAKSALNT